MYILRVEVYKNAVKILVYKNSMFIGCDAIRLRWWQRSKAKKIIDQFYIDNIAEFYNKAIEWQIADNPKIRWDFENHTIK